MPVYLFQGENDLNAATGLSVGGLYPMLDNDLVSMARLSEWERLDNVPLALQETALRTGMQIAREMDPEGALRSITERSLTLTNGCRVIPGQPYDYPTVRLNGKTISAHRAAWMIARGPIPEDTPFVLHDCDNKRCVNVDHLRLGTAASNTADKLLRDRIPKARHISFAQVARARRLGREALKAVAKEVGISYEQARRITAGSHAGIPDRPKGET